MFAMVVCQIVNCFAFWFQSCYSLHCVASFLLFGGQLRSFCSYIEYAIHVLSIISVVSLHSWYFSRTDQTNRRVVLYCMIVCVMFVCVCVSVQGGSLRILNFTSRKVWGWILPEISDVEAIGKLGSILKPCQHCQPFELSNLESSSNINIVHIIDLWIVSGTNF